MERSEATFFFVWGVATFCTAMVVYFAQQYGLQSGMLWALVPVLGLSGSYLLVRYYRKRGVFQDNAPSDRGYLEHLRTDDWDHRL